MIGDFAEQMLAELHPSDMDKEGNPDMSDLKTVRSRSLPPKRVMQVVNPVIRLILRSPLHRAMSKRMLLLTYAGRKSGKQYRIPLIYRRDGGVVTVVAGNPWWRNVRGGAPVTLRIVGEDRHGCAVPVEDKAMAERYLFAFLQGMPKFAGMYNACLTPKGQLDPTSVKEAVNSQVVVQVALAPARQTRGRWHSGRRKDAHASNDNHG